jgi:uncharacterized membrane protein YczE
VIGRVLLPIPRDRLVHRFTQLFGCLVLYGVACGLLLRSGLGADPWDVFQQGLSRTLGLQVGTWTTLVGFGCLVLWVPLRQRAGLGTLSNVLVIGPVINVALAVVPVQHALATRLLMVLVAVPLCAVATGGYIGVGMGPGPRDGLMTGLVAKSGRSVRLVRSCIELAVVIAGWALGGTVGVGTLIFAATIGPLVHVAMPKLALRTPNVDTSGVLQA